MSFLTIILLIIVLGVVACVAGLIAAGNAGKKFGAAIARIPNFSSSWLYLSADMRTGIAIDQSQRKVCLLEKINSGNFSHKVLAFDDILGAELFEDGNSITKTVKSSQIARAAVGGVLLGGVGLVVGGLSGKQVHHEKVKRIELRLTVNDMARPNRDICFCNLETTRGSMAYNQFSNVAREWQSRFEVVIKSCETQAAQPTAPAAPRPASQSFSSIYIHKNGTQYGPYNLSQVQDYLLKGSFDQLDQACHDGQNWTTVSKILEIAQGASSSH